MKAKNSSATKPVPAAADLLRERDRLAEENQRLQEELVMREELMQSLFSWITSARK